MMVAFAMLAALVAAQDFTPFLTFARSPSMQGDKVTVEVGVLPGPGRQQFWFRKTTERDGPDDIMWTDTARCPGSRDAVVAATQIAPPRVLVPGIPVRPDGSTVLTLDGVQYSLLSSAHYDSYASSEIYFTSNVNTPLANWVEGSLAILEECWSADAPVRSESDQPSPE